MLISPSGIYCHHPAQKHQSGRLMGSDLVCLLHPSLLLQRRLLRSPPSCFQDSESNHQILLGVSTFARYLARRYQGPKFVGAVWCSWASCSRNSDTYVWSIRRVYAKTIHPPIKSPKSFELLNPKYKSSTASKYNMWIESEIQSRGSNPCLFLPDSLSSHEISRSLVIQPWASKMFGLAIWVLSTSVTPSQPSLCRRISLDWTMITLLNPVLPPTLESCCKKICRVGFTFLWFTEPTQVISLWTCSMLESHICLNSYLLKYKEIRWQNKIKPNSLVMTVSSVTVIRH